LISIVSIPHTGTKFVEKLLLGLGCEVRHAHMHSTAPDPRDWLMDGCKIVVPWRDPDLARISALNRGEEPRPGSETLELLRWDGLPNVHFFTVDAASADERAFEVYALCRFLGVAVPEHVDWTPVNTSADVTGHKALYLESR
jgi:hypothetical protein